MNPISWLKLIYNQVLLILSLLSRGMRFAEALSDRLTTDEIQLQRIESKLDQEINKIQRLLDLEEILESLVQTIQDTLTPEPAASLSAEFSPVEEQPPENFQAVFLEGSIGPGKPSGSSRLRKAPSRPPPKGK